MLGDTISALGFAVCFYYGFTGLACAVYFRRDLFKSARNFFLAGLIPVVGGMMMGYVAIKAYGYYSTAGNNYSKPLAGIQTPILVGIGGLILGVVLMFASWPFFKDSSPQLVPGGRSRRSSRTTRRGADRRRLRRGSTARPRRARPRDPGASAGRRTRGRWPSPA